MGAYYTKEDITDYIGKNTTIPFLFDKVKKEYPKAFKADGFIWSFLKASCDTYIYDAVKKGVPQDGDLFEDLPEEIKAGFLPELEKKVVKDSSAKHLWEIRKRWNKKAPEKIALPTEIYREVIERRKRYAEVKSKIENGEITEINDFITYNLNIRQFAQDVMENSDDPDFIRHFFKAIKSVTILDPTCGSGAFLFAALNILEPLYETCIERMEQFTAEEPRKYKFFHEVLAEVNSEEHPNLGYYIYKTIILNNLYGVDIMHEAVEIAKLRLFLKMVGAVDINIRKPNYGLEPLPDVDFNIRAGNTLVGFASEDDFKKAVHEKDLLFAKNIISDFEDEFAITAKAFKFFQGRQLTGKGGETHKEAKYELQKRLDKLNEKLNVYLASTYGINKEKQKKKYTAWLDSHQPFHWLAEFYEIINENGGFDVVIGNPPYVEYAASKKKYIIKCYSTEKCGNLYAFVIERSYSLINDISYFGMIIPFSSASTPRMLPLVKLIGSISDSWLSSYDERPSFLFSGVCLQISIWISRICKNGKKATLKLHTSRLLHWSSEQRTTLFESILSYLPNNIGDNSVLPLKTYSSFEKDILLHLSSNSKPFFQCQLNNSKYNLYYRTSGGRYFKLVTNFPPYFNDSIGRKTSSKQGHIAMPDSFTLGIGVILLNSSLFYWYWRILSNCRDLTSREINSIKFDINAITKENKSAFSIICNSLMCDLKKNAIRKTVLYKNTGEVVYDEYYAKLSKPIIDQIDCLIAQHHGFTEEELDFIINYDIKYRMGKELDAYIEGALGRESIEKEE
jgi:hypothetical protein